MNTRPIKAILTAVLIALIALSVLQLNGTTTLQAQTVQTSSHYQIASYEVSNPQGAGAVKLQVLFKVDNQSGDTWWWDAKNNKWIKINS